MYIKFSPMRSEAPLTLSRMGDVLTINGEAFDFSALPDDATLPFTAVTCDWLAGDITRKDGELHLSLILPHGPHAPDATRFPAPITITADGTDYTVALRRTYGDHRMSNIDFSQITTLEDKAAVAQALRLQQITTQAETYLAATDWYLIRQTETGKPAPDAVKERRAAARKLLSTSRA